MDVYFYRKNNHIPKLENLYKLPQVSLSINKAYFLLGIKMAMSWLDEAPEMSNIMADSLVKDVFTPGTFYFIVQLSGTLRPVSIPETKAPHNLRSSNKRSIPKQVYRGSSVIRMTSFPSLPYNLKIFIKVIANTVTELYKVLLFLFTYLV